MKPTLKQWNDIVDALRFKASENTKHADAEREAGRPGSALSFRRIAGDATALADLIEAS
jgi:hypothetical protein